MPLMFKFKITTLFLRPSFHGLKNYSAPDNSSMATNSSIPQMGKRFDSKEISRKPQPLHCCKQVCASLRFSYVYAHKRKSGSTSATLEATSASLDLTSASLQPACNLQAPLSSSQALFWNAHAPFWSPLLCVPLFVSTSRSWQLFGGS